MGISEIFIEAALEPNKTEHKIHSVIKYIKKTGGGICWPALYWILYFVFLQEIIRRQEKLDYVVIGSLAFLVIGILLSIGVYSHLKFFKRYTNNINTWANEKENELKESLKNLNQNNDEKLKTMSDKFLASQARVIELYNYYNSNPRIKHIVNWPDEIDMMWRELYKDFIQTQ